MKHSVSATSSIMEDSFDNLLMEKSKDIFEEEDEEYTTTTSDSGTGSA